MASVLARRIARFSFAVAIFGFCLILPCQSQRKCQPLTIPLCQNLGYNLTILPNILKHESQQEAAMEVHQFFALVETKCSPDFAFFICAVYAPVCTILETAVLPCRSLCISARSGCEGLMKSFGFEWPGSLGCDRFPNFGQEEVCVGEVKPTPTPKKGKLDPDVM